MKKQLRNIAVCLCLAVFVWCGFLMADRTALRRELIRLHVVANSDDPGDQQVKLRVRDAVTEYLREAMGDIADADMARAYLQENLPRIRRIANDTLLELGLEPDAAVSFCAEEFGKRIYDTFTLPSGVYDSLRITIGKGEGQNWWCVVFPSLCFAAASEDLEAVAAGAGFSRDLIGTITEEKGYEVRFFLLDALGRLENILREG